MRTTFALTLLMTGLATSQTPGRTWTVTVTPEAAVEQFVCRRPVPPGEMAGDGLFTVTSGEERLLGFAKNGVLTFVVPKITAGESKSYAVAPKLTREAVPSFEFIDTPGESTELRFAGKPVTKFITQRRDGTSEQTHELTFKPFHHVYDPADGKTLITSGAYNTSDKSKLFPHHRGIFFGWMKATYNNKVADTWHGRKGVHTEVERELSREANPVYATQKVLIRWVGANGLQFAEEERELTAYRADGGTLLDFKSVVTTKLPRVTLDGDPQHAGVHFRATQDMVANKAKTTFTRPDGQDEPGQTRNWPGQKSHVNLPWNAMTFAVGEQPYTTVLIDSPKNPKEARWSERDYGRFGSYFVADVTPKQPVTLAYRFFVKRGTTTVEECQALANGFLLSLGAAKN